MHSLLLALALASAPGPKARVLTATEIKATATALKVDPDAVVAKQAFEVTAGGQITLFLAALNEDGVDYYLVRKGAAVAHVRSQNSLSLAFPRDLTAVAFEDVTRGGAWDVLAVEHHEGTGPVLQDGSRGQLSYDSAVYWAQQPDGTFVDQSNRLNWSCQKGKAEAPTTISIKDVRKAVNCVSALGGPTARPK